MKPFIAITGPAIGPVRLVQVIAFTNGQAVVVDEDDGQMWLADVSDLSVYNPSTEMALGERFVVPRTLEVAQ